MRLVAKQKAENCGIKERKLNKLKQNQNRKKQEEIKMEQERKRQKEIELANQWKLHEKKIKSELRSQIQLKCQKKRKC